MEKKKKYIVNVDKLTSEILNVGYDPEDEKFLLNFPETRRVHSLLLKLDNIKNNEMEELYIVTTTTNDRWELNPSTFIVKASDNNHASELATMYMEKTHYGEKISLIEKLDFKNESVVLLQASNVE